MKRLLVIASAIIGLLLTAGVLFYFFGPEMKEDRQKDAALRALLTRHATLEEVTNTLHLNFQDNSKGSTNRAGFEDWLSRQSANAFIPVREGSARYPRVYFHSTIWTMTWLFCDDEGRLQKYYLCSQ